MSIEQAIENVEDAAFILKRIHYCDSEQVVKQILALMWES